MFGLILGETDINSNKTKICNLNIHAEICSTSGTKGVIKYYGALAGWAINAIFENCSTTSDTQMYIDTSGFIVSGGLIGYANNVKLINCTNKGVIAVNDAAGYVGGLIGLAHNCTLTEDCKNQGKVYGEGSSLELGDKIG